MTTDVEIRGCSGAELAADERRLEQCVDVWLAAFAGPPWYAEPGQRDTRRRAVRDQLLVPTARAVLAVDDDVVVGAAWGWAGDAAPDDELHRAVRAAVGPGHARRLWRPEVGVLVELMVDPRCQGRGIGRLLLTSLVGDRPGWLLTHPEGAGVPLYRRDGWVEIGSFTRGGTPLLVLARTPERSD